MPRVPHSDAVHHHLIPQSYMLRFSPDKTRVHVFDRRTGKFRFAKPRNVAVEKEFNSVTTQSGELERWAEARLAEIDGAAVQCFNKVEAAEPLTDEERWCLSMFIGFAETRGTGFRESLRSIMPQGNISGADLAGSHFIDPRFAEALSEMSGVQLDPQTWERVILDDVKHIDTGMYELGGMLEGALEIARDVFHSCWLVGSAPQGVQFATSDRPVGLLVPARGIGMNPVDPHAIKVVPVSSRNALFMLLNESGPSVSGEVVNAETVRLSNVAIAQRSDRNIIASSAELLRSVIEDAGLAFNDEA